MWIKIEPKIKSVKTQKHSYLHTRNTQINHKQTTNKLHHHGTHYNGMRLPGDNDPNLHL